MESLREIYRIGNGPSSSHTMGPRKAAELFIGRAPEADRFVVTLYLKLAALMVKELAGGEICGEPVDIYPEKVEPFRVTLGYQYLNGLIGKEIPQDTVDAILRSLEMEIAERREGEVDLLVPTYRVDVQRPCDVVEDVLRIYGYNNVEISTTVHSSLQLKSITDEADDLQHLISEQLTAYGFNEILNNSLDRKSVV